MPADDTVPPSRLCRAVQQHLSALVDGSLPAWRRRLVRLHLRRCADCGAAQDAQQTLAEGLGVLGAAGGGAVIEEAVPEDLLTTLLERADKPGLRARAAVPARGAVSGARPALSVAALVLAAAVGTAAGAVVYRLVKRLAALARK